MFARQRQHIFGVDVTGNNQNGVVRGIVAFVKGHQLRHVELRNLVLPADDRHAIAVVLVLRGHQLFTCQRTGAAVGDLRAFFQHDTAFGADILGGQRQIGHPVRFHLHHQVQTVGGNTLEIGGIIETGKGVVAAAIGRDHLRKFAGGQHVGAFEHQVFQKMRDARLPFGFIRGPDLVPDHVDDNRGAAILDHDDIHAVIERVGRHLFCGGGQRQKGQDECGEKACHGPPADLIGLPSSYAAQRDVQAAIRRCEGRFSVCWPDAGSRGWSVRASVAADRESAESAAGPR